MIKIHNLTVGYDKKRSVLNHLNLSVDLGYIHGVLGLNGAGKTTFFKTLYGLKKNVTGDIFYNGKKITKNDLSFLPTENYFYSYLTGREYLEIFKSEKIFEIDKWEALFQIPLDDFIESYSTGMKKKLALLANIKLDKDILILDEPFNGLDLETNRILRTVIQKLKLAGKTIFFSSHVLDDMLTICDQIHHLNLGKIEKSYQKQDFKIIEQDIFNDLDNVHNQ